MKNLTAVALALLVGAGGGFGISQMIKPAEVAPTESFKQVENVPEAMRTTEKTHGADDPVVAKVNGEPVYRTDVLEFIKTLPEQMRQVDPKQIFPMAIEQVISGKIVDEKAKAEGFGSDPLVAERMDDARVQIIRSVYAEKQLDKVVTADKVKAAYDEIVKNMPKVDEVHARHILVDSESQAKDIISKLNAGAKFEDLAKEFSKDKSNSGNGGDLGYFAQGDMVKEFADEAFALKPNEYTKTPVKTQFGYHVVQSLDKRVRPAPKFDDVKMQVEGQVKRDTLNKLVAEWRGKATVEEFDYDGNPLPKPEEKKADAPIAETPTPTPTETPAPAPTEAPAAEQKAE